MTKKRRVTAGDAKEAIIGGALACVSLFEFLEGLEGGETTVRAAKRAFRRARVRRRALKKVAEEVKKDLEGDAV